MPESILTWHQTEVELRDEWVPGYGDTSQLAKRPWLVCSCGQFSVKLVESFQQAGIEARMAALEHVVTILAGQSKWR